jgi:hypothetical protein
MLHVGLWHGNTKKCKDEKYKNCELGSDDNNYNIGGSERLLFSCPY